MKTFVVLLSLALVVASFAMEEEDGLMMADEQGDDTFVKRAMDDLQMFMKRAKGSAFFPCSDRYDNPGCICKMRRGKKTTISCF